MIRSTECETLKEREVSAIRRIFGDDIAKTYENKTGAVPNEQLPRRKVINEYNPHERRLE